VTPSLGATSRSSSCRRGSRRTPIAGRASNAKHDCSHRSIIHTSGQSTVSKTPGNLPALVLELVEGDTLDVRLRRGLLPLSEALAVAQQIADALEAAHRAGIIHRDLKPSNISPMAFVKVLDFVSQKPSRPKGPIRIY
jgi:serine/threonine protein kinase